MHKDTYTTANPYTDNGYSSRADYLAQLCDEYPADVVHTLADLLGETEDFDGLVSMLEDYSETEAARDAADDAATGFRDALAARDAARDAWQNNVAHTERADAAAVLSVRTARENLTGAYLEADAALNAARAAYADALKAYTAASAALNAAD